MATATTDVPEYADLIGKGFQIGGRGAEVYDCYGLLIELHRRQGIVIPDVVSVADKTKQALKILHGISDWKSCELVPGASLTFQLGRVICHVGFVVSETEFVHCWQHGNIGVAKEKIADWQHRIAGCWRYAGKNNAEHYANRSP